MKETYKVLLTVTSTHEYIVPEANTSDEAETYAEDLYANGDLGDVVEEDIDNIDSYPIDEEGE